MQWRTRSSLGCRTIIGDPGLRGAAASAREARGDFHGHPVGSPLRPRAERLPQLRHLHRDLPGSALLRLQPARDRPAAVDGEPRGHLRRDAGEDLGLRAVLHLRRALPVREFARRADHADARDRDQARDGIGQERAAPLQPRDAEADLDRQPARSRHDQRATTSPTGDRTSRRSTRR